ncbi:MAG: LUD domain-containing protein [archaeon]|nr:LUD domain-containing protein [archaeon]
MPKNYNSLKAKIAESLTHLEKTNVLAAATKRSRNARATQLASLQDSDRFLAEVKELKRESISDLDSLLGRFVASCKANGANILIAKTGQDVVRYLLELAQKNNVKLIGKSKSLTTEEIELNQHLEEEGINVVETDLGERIIQLAHEKPFHLVFPAVHKSQKEVAELFSYSFNTNVPDDLNEIMKAIRKELRPIFLDTGIGVTGANVAVAETGTIVIETNEGNARLVSGIPDIHVVVVGMEKIVPTWEDALKLVMAHPVSATGTRLTNYVSMISQRRPLEGHPTRELHVIVLDNGRTKMRQDPWFKEALSCIRCGACMNICPTYGVVGGHTFGYIYPGPIGIPWTEEIHGLDKASEFAHLCISCGLCREICPADIDIPMMIAKVKEKDVKANGQLLPNKILSRSDRFAKIASSTAPVSNWIIQSRLSRRLMDQFLGIEKKRKIPRFERVTFEKRFRKLNTKIENPRGKVVYFLDIFANYNKPALAEKAVRLLNQKRILVEIPPKLKASGMPLISYGELEEATKIASHNVSLLETYVEDGYDIVATEPTAIYCLKEIYPKLLDHSKSSKTVSAHSFEFFEYLALHNASEGSSLTVASRPIERKPIGFHIPCHQRALSSGKYTIDFLKDHGFNPKVIETGTCCGMAGTFGLKKGELGYKLSMAVGKPLFELFENDGSIELIATESSVCTEQLTDGTRYRVVHPLDLVTDTKL